MCGGFNTNIIKADKLILFCKFSLFNLLFFDIFDVRCLPKADFYSWAINL